MNKMKENRKLLWMYAMIGVLGACVTGYFLYQNKVKYWKQQAYDAFPTALKQELKKRNSINVYFATSGSINLPEDVTESKVVTMKSRYGKREYVIPYLKHRHNIETNIQQRGLHSVILEEHPLNADELNNVWDSLLVKMAFRGRTGTRVSVTDLSERETCTYSDKRYAKADSLISCYIGYRSEVGVTGYIHCSLWEVFSAKDVILLCALFLGCLSLFFIDKYVVLLYRRFFVKVVAVIPPEGTEAHIYQLEENLFFDSYSGRLWSSKAEETLTSQLVMLLQGFLSAKDYKLTNKEIMQLLWPNEVALLDSRIYSAVKRLRASLRAVSDWTIENGNLAYQLKKAPFHRGKSGISSVIRRLLKVWKSLKNILFQTLSA